MSETLEYSIDVTGSEQSASAFIQLKAAQLEAAEAAQQLAGKIRTLSQAQGDNRAELQRLRIEQARAAESARTLGEQAERSRVSVQRAGTGLQIAGGFANQFSQALATTNPQLSQTVGYMGQLSASAGQNIQQFGLLGGAMATAFQMAIPPLADGINKLTHYRTLVQEFNSAFAEYLPAAGRQNLNNISQGSSSLNDYNEGGETPEARALRERRIREAEQRGAEFARLVTQRLAAGRAAAGRGASAAQARIQQDQEYQRGIEQFEREFQEQEALVQDQLRSIRDQELANIEATNALHQTAQEQRNEIYQQDLANRRQSQEQQEQLNARERGIWEASSQGLEAVIRAATSANRALLSMHQQTLDSGLVWANGMRGIGADVSNALGSSLTNAFSSSLDAWLSGSKTFGEAALDMARSVTKALTQQGIIKAITETAEGLGALAITWGVPNPASLLHFASAGTWAAIAGVAGGIGAGIGAFGGGAGAGAGAANRGSQGQSRMQPANQQGGGTTVININVPNSMMTNYERAQFIGNSMQQARRQGYRVAA
jgi:hypothetical protein